MRFRVDARGLVPITVVLEPTGAEYVLQPGEYFDFEWEDPPAELAGLIGSITHEPDVITIGEGGGRARMWNSDGEEMSMI